MLSFGALVSYFCTILYLLIYLETDCSYIAQARHKFLCSSDPPASTSKVARIIGPCHHVWLDLWFCCCCLINSLEHSFSNANALILHLSDSAVCRMESRHRDCKNFATWQCSVWLLFPTSMYSQSDRQHALFPSLTCNLSLLCLAFLSLNHLCPCFSSFKVYIKSCHLF